ncbi:MAG: hypothetical protein HC919_08445, partial [Oscillatoriales cyanobacterium SM2_2_1]|nr:hypothetical protein [Oscillatoriales cyanobacterium SM2_2_1]
MTWEILEDGAEPMLTVVIADASCLEAVAAEIRHQTEQPLFLAARVGVFAQQGDRVLVNLDGDRRFVPASVVKLATTVAVWRQLGEQFQVVTRVWGDRLPDHNGTVGRVWVEGAGDPQLTTAHLQNLARHLRQRGIRRILASSVGSNLRGWGIAPTWEVGDLGEYYGAIAHGFD